METKYTKLVEVKLSNETDIVMRKGREFYSFDDLDELEEWASDKEDIHEVILDKRPCKIYFDIDAKKGQVEDNRDILTQGICIEIKNMLLVNFNIELKDDELIICERHRQDKWSFHIIIRNYYVERKDDIKNMLNLEHIKNTYSLWEFFDQQVYKSKATLSISNGTYKGHKMKVKGSYMFSELLISHIPKSYQKVDITFNDQINRTCLGNIDVSDAFMNKVMQYVDKIKDHDDLKQYEPRGTNENIIEFKRVTSGIHQCSLCGGKHTKDNKLYIICFEQDDMAYLQCRKEKKRKSYIEEKAGSH